MSPGVRESTTHDVRADRLTQVRSQVSYHGERLARYRRLHGSRPCQRLHDLENAYRSAQQRLASHSGPSDGKPAVEPSSPSA